MSLTIYSFKSFYLFITLNTFILISWTLFSYICKIYEISLYIQILFFLMGSSHFKNVLDFIFKEIERGKRLFFLPQE